MHKRECLAHEAVRRWDKIKSLLKLGTNKKIFKVIQAMSSRFYFSNQFFNIFAASRKSIAYETHYLDSYKARYFYNK